ncbi:MAG TPA: hypothetical protein VGH36_11540 [Acetobacteraceae bacterium]
MRISRDASNTALSSVAWVNSTSPFSMIMLTNSMKTGKIMANSSAVAPLDREDSKRRTQRGAATASLWAVICRVGWPSLIALHRIVGSPHGFQRHAAGTERFCNN